jgi:hypothetical protein
MGGIDMILQEDKIILDDGLEFEFDENYEEVKTKYDTYDVSINEDEEYIILRVKNVEAFGYKADLRIVYRCLKLKKFLVSFHMPSKLGQTFDSWEEYIEANKAFYRKMIKDVKPVFSQVPTTEFREHEFGFYYRTKKYDGGFGIERRDYESVCLSAESLTLY